jgi:hypothetical protein
MAEAGGRELLPALECLVTGGKFNFGTFSDQFRNVNPLDAEKPLGIHLPKTLLKFRLKEWQAFQLGNDKWFLLAVLYNAKFSALAQFIAFNKETGQKYVFDRLLPPWVINVPASIWDSRQSYWDGDDFLEIVSSLEKGRFYIKVSINERKGSPGIKADFEIFHDRGVVSPIVVSIPFGDNRGVYSHKCLMPMQGSMRIGAEAVDFRPEESFAIIDDHKGFYPYRMKYDWVTAAGHADGKLIGFNLTDNQSIDPEKYNENCLWYDGRLQLLPPVKFCRPEGVEGEWLIADKQGRVDLAFKPVSVGKIDMNLLLIRVKYYGPFGYVKGFIKDETGCNIDFDGYFGMGEQKYVRG